MDATCFYLADEQADGIYVWNAPPQSATNPLFSINVPDPQRINSDGTYLVVTTGPSHAVRVDDVASLNASGNPLAIAGGVGTFNLPMDAHVSNGRVFVADTGFSRVHALIGWRRVGWATYNATDGRTYPAVGNVDGTGAAEIVLGLCPGSHGWIEIFTSSSGNYAHRDWIRVPWPTYNAQNGETHVAAGDVDGDGRAEIVAGLGTGGYGWVHVFDDASASYAPAAWLRTSWSTYNADGTRSQTFPAVGDVDGDPRAEIVVGPGPYPGTGGWFEVLDDGSTGSLGWRNVGWPAFTSAGGGCIPLLEDSGRSRPSREPPAQRPRDSLQFSNTACDNGRLYVKFPPHSPVQ